MTRRIGLPVALDDLRLAGVQPYPPVQAYPRGAGSPYGPDAPFGSPAFAQRDADDLTPASMPRVAEPVAGWSACGSLAPEQRFRVRVPRAWNGRLVVAGTPGQRSEFACDLLFGDPLLARGYAYACSNKGQGDGAVLLESGATLAAGGVVLPRFELPGGNALAFYQHAPGHTIEAWRDDFIALTETACETVAALHGRAPEVVYAAGLSNGGYQTRRAIETSDLFNGALTWNAVLWTAAHNVLAYLPHAIEALEAGRPERLAALGIPPDVAGSSGGSLYKRNLTAYYYVTAWLHATQLDPQTSIAYGDTADAGAAEAWQSRIGSWRLDRSSRIAERIEGFANTGAVRCKLIEVAAEFDHLIPPAVHDAPYAALVDAAGKRAQRRSRVIARAQHVDSWSDTAEYPSMRTAFGDVWTAFDELVNWVE